MSAAATAIEARFFRIVCLSFGDGREHTAFPLRLQQRSALRLERAASTARESRREMSLHVPPLACENAVHHAVTHGPVASREVMADHAVLLGADGFDRALGSEVEIIGAEADHFA